MTMTLRKSGPVANGVSCQAVSQDGQAPDYGPPDYCPADDMDPSAAVFVATFPMPPGLVFDWHTHPDHQLAWAASGVLTVRSDTATWVLPPTRALWIPAGVRHETLSAGAATMRSAYVRPAMCPIEWAEPTPVSASPLLGELIGYLERRGLDTEQRAHAEAVLVDLLQPVAMTTIEVRMPADDRARQVADRMAADPADDRTLAEWGHEIGASERTLARAFLAGTGVSFGRWRTLLRVQTALVALADGEPVGNVARHVGYESDSAFVAAFRRETGVTPAAYFRGNGSTVPT
jgi:AraC-like DNA-binding protein/quercetin dioxygenase-like cupin family protein